MDKRYAMIQVIGGTLSVEYVKKRKRIAALQRTELFRFLGAEELAEIAQRAVKLHFKKGEMLFLSGEEAKGLFVVVKGQIGIFQRNAERREQVVMRMVLPPLSLLKSWCSMLGRIRCL